MGKQGFLASYIALRIYTFVLLGNIFFPIYAQREYKTINDGWKYWKGECTGAADSTFNDSGWMHVNLPHTWNADAYVEKDYYQGTGWYRRSVTIPSVWTGKRIFLKIDAASKVSVLFINGKKVGEHAGGYTASVFDITSFLTIGKENSVAIRVNNACRNTPPISGDFTFFGGIYRDVWLIATSAQHFNLTNEGAEGIFITTPEVSAEKGRIAIRGEVKNDACEKATVDLQTTVYAPDGKLVQHKETRLHLEAGKTGLFSQESGIIPNPQLWTPETPYLYRVETALTDPATGKVLDYSEHHVGFRWYHFDAQKGFFLNGKPYKLRGVCRHQDQRPMGVSLSDEMHRRDFRLMKEMGANFIRLAHYPQDEAMLEMCDRLGMLVWEEIPVIDIVPDNPEYENCCEQNLREMIRQHYNHPSIILWGYMNEILLVTQRRYKTEQELRPVLERTHRLAERLEKVLKKEDSSRFSVMAFHGSNIYNETKLSEITDVVGWNLYAGWYGGDLNGFNRFLEEQQRDYPTHPLIVSEYGAGSDKRLHTLHPRPFDFSSEYQQIYLEHYLPILENTPYVCGGAYWNFIDFSSALREESMPRINNKGLLSANRTPKDVYYYYQEAWRPDIPVLHIAGRDWNYRSGVQKGKDSLVYLPVKVYTNLPEVELFVEGKSIGKRKTANYHVTFDVPFSESYPFLLVQGVYKDKTIQDGVRMHFCPVPEHLALADRDDLELAVNVGSNCFFTSEESQLTWLPDQEYQSGSWGYVGGKEINTQSEIRLTAEGPLYQTLRENLNEYRFDVPPGVYEVELLFADIYRPTQSAAYLLGRDENTVFENGNSFDIWINGICVEPAFAPYRESGYFQAVKKRYIVRNTDQTLKVTFVPIQGKSFLSGIKLRKL